MRHYPENTLDDESFISAVKLALSQLPDEIQLHHMVNPRFFDGDDETWEYLKRWLDFHDSLPQNQMRELTRILNAINNAWQKPAHDHSVGRVIYDESDDKGGTTLGDLRIMSIAQFESTYRFKKLGYNSFEFLISIGLMKPMPDEENSVTD